MRDRFAVQAFVGHLHGDESVEAFGVGGFEAFDRRHRIGALVHGGDAALDAFEFQVVGVLFGEVLARGNDPEFAARIVLAGLAPVVESAVEDGVGELGGDRGPQGFVAFFCRRIQGF